MRAIEILLGVSVFIILLAAVFGGITSLRSAEYVEPHNISTTAGVTSADIVLTQELFDSQTSWVTITSNYTSDAAIPVSYIAATKTLTVGGLIENHSRRLTITYRYNQLVSYWAADLMARTWPLLLILGSIGLIAAAAYAAWPQKNGGGGS
jgi:hypothetical protein